MLDDAEGRFLPSISEAIADLGRGVLAATAGGGAIRGVGYGGREATSVLIERFRLGGSWTGTMPVEITMKLRYRFEGDGESRLGALLRSSIPREFRAVHQAAMWVYFTGLGGAVVLEGRTRGRFEQPADGAIANGTTIELKVTQNIDAAKPDLEIRADLIAYAMPNLGSFEESLTSLVQGAGRDRAHRALPLSHRDSLAHDRLERQDRERPGPGAGLPVLTGPRDRGASAQCDPCGSQLNGPGRTR